MLIAAFKRLKLRLYAAWADYQSRKHPYAISSAHTVIVGRIYVRNKKGVETLTDLAIKNVRTGKITLVKL